MRIGDYIFYPAFFVIFIFLPIAIISISYILYVKLGELRGSKLNCISPKYSEMVEKYYEGVYKEELLYYLENNKSFFPEATLAYGDDFVSITSKNLFELFLRKYEENKTLATNILTLIDFLNSTLEYNGKSIEWIGNDISSQTYSPFRDEYEARLENLYASSIDNVLSKMSDESSAFGNQDVFYKLKKYQIVQAEHFKKLVFEAENIYKLNIEVVEFLSSCLINDVIKYLELFDEGLLGQARVYKIRALACVLNNKPYDLILRDNKK